MIPRMVDTPPEPSGPYSVSSGGQARNLAANQFWGRGIEHLFPEGSAEKRTAPWEGMSRTKADQDYDSEVVKDALRHPPQPVDIDPRGVRATQPSITKGGVKYYAEDETYRETGETYADKANVGNKFPMVYQREGKDGRPGENLLLSGHHRAAAALVKGEPLRAIIVRGPWGPPRP